MRNPFHNLSAFGQADEPRDVVVQPDAIGVVHRDKSERLREVVADLRREFDHLITQKTSSVDQYWVLGDLLDELEREIR